MDNVDKIKDMQRNDPVARDQWWAYCDASGGGVRDPAKHDDLFQQTFIDNYTAGMRFEVTSAAGDQAGGLGNSMSDLFKEGQRKSQPWKMAWGAYCDLHGGKHDPARHDENFLRYFLDFVGQQGVIALQSGMGFGMGMEMMGGAGMAYAGVPSAKRQRTDSSGYMHSDDDVADQLVAQVKAYQRSGELNKHEWWDFAETHLGGVRDPAKHDVATLRRFISMYNVP
eukprot:TRINITY_DN2603_c0_g3_i1.p1 TRINITY_DN2603_c0_g3~~TRINITY_DN2603_c0_g3_i1.p1  ORF type:complete len:255 (-),score=39.86 TRINITY_DN2603_c0_g3_i1:59-733(-)